MTIKTTKQSPIISVQSVGIDVSMDTIDCCFCYMTANRETIIKGTSTFENTPQGFKEFLEWVSKREIDSLPVFSVMEATGVYYENLACFLSENTKFKVVVMLPNKAKAYKQSLNIKSKTDKIDAKALAFMGLERRLEEWKAPSKAIQTMKELCRAREALLENKTMISNQLHAMEHSASQNKMIIKRLKQLMLFIDKQILQTEKDIKAIIKKDAALDLKIKQLCSIPGVGWLSAAIVIAETNNFALFRNKQQLVSYAGLDVIQNQSGKFAGKSRISKKGNSRLRKALYFPAMTHVRSKALYSDLFERVYKKSNIKMQGYVAVQRKLLTLMYALHKNNSFFISLSDQGKPKEKEVGSNIVTAYGA